MPPGTDLSGTSLWNVANVKDFKQAVDSIPQSILGLGSAFTKMATEANKAIKSVRDNLGGLQKELGSSGMGGRSGGTSRWWGGWGGGGNGYSGWGSSMGGSTTDAVDALNGRPTFSSMSPGGGGGSAFGTGMDQYGFSWTRFGIGAGMMASGAAARAAQPLVQQGITQSQLDFWLKNATGGQKGRQWAMSLPNWAWASSTPQNLGDLMQGLQGLGAAGYGPSTGRFASMAGQAGALSSIAQNAGIGMTFSQASQVQQFANSNGGYYGRLRAGVNVNNTNLFSAAQQIARQSIRPGQYNAQSIGNAFTQGTGAETRLMALVGGNQQAAQTLTTYLEMQARNGGSLAGANNMTPQQISQQLGQLGTGGTITSKLQKSAQNQAQATAGMANDAASYYAATRASLTAIEKYTAQLPLIRNILGAMAAFGGLSAAAGNLPGMANTAGGALKMGRRIAGKIGNWRAARGVGTAAEGEAVQGVFPGMGAAGAAETAGAGAGADIAGAATVGAMGAGLGVAAVGAGLAYGSYYAWKGMLANDKNFNWAPGGPLGGLHGKGINRAQLSPLSGGVGDLSAFAQSNFNGRVGGTGSQGIQGNSGGSVGMPTTAVGGASSGIVGIAEKYLGIPYLWGGTDPSKGLDCSGYTQLVYKQAGINLPRTTYDQVKTGSPVPNLAAARAGDLLFYAGSDGTPSNPGHVGIYIGGGKMIDAPYTGQRVRIETAGNPVAIRREVPGLGGGSSSLVGSIGIGGGSSLVGSSGFQNVLSSVGEGNSGVTEAGTIASAMFASFSFAATAGPGTSTNGGLSGNTTGNGATGSAGAVGPIPSGQHMALIKQSLRLAGIPDSAANEAAVNAIVNHESGWNPSAINRWDSNARAGHPSQGLMQTIPSTFAAYAIPGYNKNILDSLSNLIAGERYAVSTYGSLTNVPGVAAMARGGGYVGYEGGSQYIDRDQMAMLHRGEMVVRAGDASARRMLQGSARSAPLVNVEKGAVTFVLGSSPLGGGTTGSTSLPNQQQMEESADQFWAHIEKKAALARVAAD